MQPDQNVPRPFPLLMHAIAYELGGIFLLDAGIRYCEGAGAVIAKIFGVLFMVVGFLLAISSFVQNVKLTAFINRINFQLFLGLFFVTVADLFIVALESTKYQAALVVVAFAFSLILLAAMFFWSFRTEARLREELGSRAISARVLRRLSVVFSMVALGMVIAQVNVMGGPILYMALSLVCLSVASLL